MSDYFTFESGAATDQGCVRDHNEDSLLVRPDYGIWAVADGMGGHAAGDVASQIIVDELGSVGVPGSAADLQARFMERLTRAHMRIIDHAHSLGGGTMGATLVGLLAFDDAFACIWSGDSRIYLLRDGVLVPQTADHTEVRELLASGAISESEAAVWPRKNVITRAIGVSAEPNCDVVSGVLEEGDTFLLCSDGLTEHIEDHEIAAYLQGHSAQQACDMLVAETLARGARDNVTAVVMRAQAAVWEV